MFRPVADLDIGKADWWGYPLERNAFKRRVVRGDLSAVFVLPNTQKLWAFGEGGLVLHSADGGSNWVQQRPAVAARTAVNGQQARTAGAWSPFSVALAEQPDPKQQAAPNLAAQQKLNAPPLSEVAANPATQAVNPGRNPDSSPKAEPAPAKPLADARSPTLAPPSAVDAKAGTKAQEPVPPPIGPAPDNGNLNAVFFATERLGWAVGENGTILATREGGNAWTPQTSGTHEWLNSVHFTADGQHGWAVGENGTILATRDGGNAWTPQTSGTGWLLSVHFAADGQRGWAVGTSGTILATGDGGRLWSALAPYQRYGAPWYLATLALLGFTLFLLLGLVETAQPGSGADTGPPLADGSATLLRSDQPVADKLFDRLGVRPAVEALSSFIRNRDTEPRVTIAVTGEWGNGKSSVMRMLQTELERAGFRTAWFNAWHHQQEGRQLTALFEAVRKQAVPRWWRQPVSALRV